jgi:hypothetical protein
MISGVAFLAAAGERFDTIDIMRVQSILLIDLLPAWPRLYVARSVVGLIFR